MVTDGGGGHYCQRQNYMACTKLVSKMIIARPRSEFDWTQHAENHGKCNLDALHGMFRRIADGYVANNLPSFGKSEAIVLTGADRLAEIGRKHVFNIKKEVFKEIKEKRKR